MTAAEEAKNFELHAFSFWDGIGIYMKIAAIFSLVISVPLIFYQLWAFVKPGLRKEEQKAAIRYVPYAFILFIVGIAFGYYIVFPMTLSYHGDHAGHGAPGNLRHNQLLEFYVQSRIAASLAV